MLVWLHFYHKRLRFSVLRLSALLCHANGGQIDASDSRLVKQQCLVAGHVLGLSCAGCTTGWLSYSHQCQCTDGAERLRPEAEAIRRRDSSQVTVARSKFYTRRAQQAKKKQKTEERPEQGRRPNLMKREQPVLLHLLGGKELLLWKCDDQSSKYSFRRSHTRELSLRSAAFFPLHELPTKGTLSAI